MAMSKSKIPRICALCDALLSDFSTVNLCDECLAQADCCVGLERLRD